MPNNHVFIPNFPSVESIRRTIAELRRREGMSQKELGKLAGFSQSVVSRVIGEGTDRKEARNVGYEEIRIIAKVILERALRTSGQPALSTIDGVLVNDGRILRTITRFDKTSPMHRPSKHI